MQTTKSRQHRLKGSRDVSHFYNRVSSASNRKSFLTKILSESFIVSRETDWQLRRECVLQGVYNDGVFEACVTINLPQAPPLERRQIAFCRDMLAYTAFAQIARVTCRVMICGGSIAARPSHVRPLEKHARKCKLRSIIVNHFYALIMRNSKRVDA